MPKGKRKRDDKAVTEVGEEVLAWEVKRELVGLRRIVDVQLALRGERHVDAARRAGVTTTFWSKIVNAARIRERDLELIAKGIGRSTSWLAKEASAK